VAQSAYVVDNSEGALRELDGFLDSGDFDDEFLRPTPSAVAAARGLLAAQVLNGRRSPARPAFSTLGDGSIHLQWKWDGREVRVLVPPTEDVPVRLYYLDGETDGVESRVTPEALGRRLQWLVGG
jgi:hypothetical protein